MENPERKEHSRPLPSTEILEIQLLPQPAQTTIPSRPQQQRETKQKRQSASQKINATLILPQTFVVAQPNTNNKVGTSHNVVQGILPFLQLGTRDASKTPQLQSEKVTQLASSPTTSVSTTGKPTETLAEVSTSKRKHKPTSKAQALIDEKRNKVSKKQAAKKQQNSSVSQTVAVLPQTSTWILTPSGLMPVAEIQVQAPGTPARQNKVMPNNVQIVFPPPIKVSQSSCAAPTNAMRPDNPTSSFQTAGSNHGPNRRTSSVSDNHIVASLSSSSNSPSVISSVTNIPSSSLPQVIPDTKVPISITPSAAKIPLSKTASNQQSVTLMNPMSSLVLVSSSSVGTSKNLTSSHISDAASNIPGVPLVSVVTSAPSSPSVRPLNISGPGTLPRTQSQRMPHPVSQMVFKQPAIVNQCGSLTFINTAGPCKPNAPPATTAKVTRVPPNSASSKTNKVSKGSLALINAAGPCLIENAPSGTADVSKVPFSSASPTINKSNPTSSPKGPGVPSYLLIPSSALPSVLDGASHSIPQSIFVNSAVGVNVGGLPKDKSVSVNPPISPTTTICQILPQTVVQQMPPQAKKQTVQTDATTSNSRPKQITFDPSLMFFEQPAQVNNWLNGNGGITLPGLEDKMPYLPPFVSSINTLTTLLEGRHSLLKSAVQLLPEEHRESHDEEAKIAAVRKMVSERFKTNQAYLLLKARFLSCFTLPALLATINPCRESKDALDQEHSMDKGKPKQFGDDDLC